jgi:signal transduction histidine kinase/CheY-like chemotaxis protein
MREGTTQPAQGEVSEDTEGSPERADPRGRDIFAPSNVLDTPHKNTPNNDANIEGLTLTDFANLVRFSSAAIGCVSFAEPPHCASPPEAFADLLYAIPSKCLQASVSFAHNLGLTSPDLLIGKPLTHLLPEHRGFKDMLREWRRRGFTREGFEWDVLDLQGNPSVLHVALYGHIEKDQLHRFWIVIRDISALSRAIRNSGTTEKHYRDLLNAGGLIFFRTHLDGTISFCTPSTQETLMLECLPGSPLENILERACHPEDRSVLEQLSFHRRSLSQSPLRVSLRLISRARGLLHVTLHHIPHLVSGEIDSYDILGVEEIAPKALAPQAATTETLAACIAHDVNNQLTVASATIELACKKLGDNHPAMEFLRTALQAVSHTASINSQTLHLASGISATPSRIDVSELFRELIDQCEAIISDGIALTSSIPSPSLHAWADRTHIRQILLNLIINARDALGDSGIITLSATPKGATSVACESPIICISVSDNGPGIDQSVTNTLFTPFVSTKATGTPRGLGLAMVKTLVEKNSGSISVTSARGIGTTFTLCLPTPQRHQDTATELPHGAPPSQVAKSLCVLVADDESEVRRTLMSALTSRGHQPVAVTDLHSLQVELSRADRLVDVMLVDGGMIDSPIEEFLTSARALRANIAVLITSGDRTAARHLPQECRSSGFLAKPFTLKELYEAIESMRPVSE